MLIISSLVRYTDIFNQPKQNGEKEDHLKQHDQGHTKDQQDDNRHFGTMRLRRSRFRDITLVSAGRHQRVSQLMNDVVALIELEQEENPSSGQAMYDAAMEKLANMFPMEDEDTEME
jgi:hypothetical protein